MKLVKRNNLFKNQREAVTFPGETLVVGTGHISWAKRIKVHCSNCNHQPAESRIFPDYGDGHELHSLFGLVDIDEILSHAKLAKDCGYAQVVSVDELNQQPFYTELQCDNCGTINIIGENAILTEKGR